MKLSIVQSLRMAEATAAIEVAQASGDGAKVFAAFANLALASDDLVRSQWFGWFRKKPSTMGVEEFLNFVKDTLPTIAALSPRDKALVDSLVAMKPR